MTVMAWDAVPIQGDGRADAEVGALVEPAWRLRWRAPELALVLGERAAALAAGRRDEPVRLRAEALVVFALNRLGSEMDAAERGMAALRDAEAAAERELAWLLRIEVASCAVSAGAQLTGFGVLRPVLEASGVPPALRAAALIGVTDCLVHLGRSSELTEALSEADRLYTADRDLDADTRLLAHAQLRAAAARHHRRWGDFAAAIEAAQEGLTLLKDLEDAGADSGQASGLLVLEQVCALLDADKRGEAAVAAEPVLDRPVRASSAATAGWLRLTLSTRLHLPAGRQQTARDLLHDAADTAARHQLDALHSESLAALSHVHEVCGELAEALTCLRTAHAAERRRSRGVHAVRLRLAEEFATVRREPTGLREQVAALLSKGAPAQRSAETADLRSTSARSDWPKAEPEIVTAPARVASYRPGARDETLLDDADQGPSAAKHGTRDPVDIPPPQPVSPARHTHPASRTPPLAGTGTGSQHRAISRWTDRTRTGQEQLSAEQRTEEQLSAEQHTEEQLSAEQHTEEQLSAEQHTEQHTEEHIDQEASVAEPPATEEKPATGGRRTEPLTSPLTSPVTSRSALAEILEPWAPRATAVHETPSADSPSAEQTAERRVPDVPAVPEQPHRSTPVGGRRHGEPVQNISAQAPARGEPAAWHATEATSPTEPEVGASEGAVPWRVEPRGRLRRRAAAAGHVAAADYPPELTLSRLLAPPEAIPPVPEPDPIPPVPVSEPGEPEFGRQFADEPGGSSLNAAPEVTSLPPAAEAPVPRPSAADLAAADPAEPALPVSRRSRRAAKDEVGLADLLAEALLAYDTGRRSSSSGADETAESWLDALADEPSRVEPDTREPISEPRPPLIDLPRHEVWIPPGAGGSSRHRYPR